MLHPDKAREEVRRYRLKDGTQRCVAALGKLPRESAAAGLAFFARDARGEPIRDHQEQATALAEAARFLEGSTASERGRVFSALFPGLAAAIEGAWQLLHRSPYGHLPFRAPHNPAVTLAARVRWLRSLLHLLKEYQEDVLDARWLAVWAPYLEYWGSREVCDLLAAAVDAGGPEGEAVFEILRASATGEHEVAGMGGHVALTLLTASRPDGWDLMEKTLLAAQRQEGLRQSVLEAVRTGHPQAFRRMLKLILDHKLLRFSSVLRTAGSWTGHQRVDVGHGGAIHKEITQLHDLLNADGARRQALARGDGETFYLGLWSLAFDDADRAVEESGKVQGSEEVGRRFAAVTLLTQLEHPAATPLLCRAAEDPDLRVALTAFHGLRFRPTGVEGIGWPGPEEIWFPMAERLLARMPANAEKWPPLVRQGREVSASRPAVAANLLSCLGRRPPTALVPFLPQMIPWTRCQVVQLLAGQKRWDTGTRSALFDLFADRNGMVREAALQELKKVRITPEEARRLEALLKRRSRGLRRDVADLLTAQADKAALASCDRLLMGGRRQRLAGLELLRRVAEADRRIAECRARAAAYRARYPDLADEEREHLDAVLRPDRKPPTLDDALGLMDLARLTPVVPPKKRRCSSSRRRLSAATRPALAIQSLVGLDTLLRLLTRLGGRPFRQVRQGRQDESPEHVLTHLISVTLPGPEDTPEAFAGRVAEAVAAGRFPSQRVVELAFVAPLWTAHVEHCLGWPGFAEGVWWFFAHMLGAHDHAMNARLETREKEEEEVRPGRRRLSVWERLLRQRTPLNREERAEGVLDVDWFRRVFEPLGPTRWQALTAAAPSGESRRTALQAGHVSGVLLGKASKRDLVVRVRQKKSKQAVRLLGLLPLPEGPGRDKDLLDRYRVLQEYRRHADSLRKSKPDALRAVDIGLENLARTAGYPDPVRLEWAMEARVSADLAAGPVTETIHGVTVSLAVGPDGQPELTVRRGDETLASVPRAARAHKGVAALLQRRTELRRQASRIRRSLEAAMCRGDVFTGAELQQLIGHPMLAPSLASLVLVGEGLMGYPVRDGTALLRPMGEAQTVKPSDRLRIAHAHDLLRSGEWHSWQHECFTAGRVQPFKQVFRELYLVTAQETKDGLQSHRYAGQQVNPAQAQALFNERSWDTRDGVHKTLREAGILAEVWFQSGGGTPLAAAGWTLEGVGFRRRDSWEPLPLSEVPSLVFSEVMRDLDLVVSVAHLGGVDPEATASTVEMRTALLRETCALLALANVRFKANHALIDGRLGNYTVHLGSGVVHRLPGGHLCIVPVYAEHRGRLFLPFADDDPRSAEVLSKVILLARDEEIRDPGILGQIRGGP